MAGRYFHLKPWEWDELPWWVTTCYMEGLVSQGVFGKDAAAASPAAGTPGTSLNADLTGDLGDLPPGFQTRRAG